MRIFETAEPLVNLVAIFWILSWRIFWITMLNRTSPNAPLQDAFTEVEQYLLDELVPNSTHRGHPHGISDYIVKLARLGSHLARAHKAGPELTLQVGWIPTATPV